MKSTAKESLELYKLIEIKQHTTTEWWMGKKFKMQKSFLEINENENTTHQNFLWGKIIFPGPTLKNQRNTNKSLMQLKSSAKEKQTKPKSSRQEEIIKNREERNKLEEKQWI